MTDIRTDIVDVYIFRRNDGTPELLQLLRAGDPMGGTWHPLMGHTEPGETAAACALRELHEEVGLSASDPALLGFWQLEQVHPYFIASLDCVVMSPRFCVEVERDWQPKLNSEHTDHRWAAALSAFMWPGQRAAVAEVLRIAAEPDSTYARSLRIDPGSVQQ